MKICMIDPLFYPYFGGTEKVVLEVGSRLVSNHGYEVDVLTSRIPQANGKKEEIIKGMKVFRTRSVYFDKLPGFLPPPFTLTPKINYDLVTKHRGADVYHVHNRFWYSLNTLYSAKMLGKLMLTIHNARPDGISGDVDRWGSAYDDTFGKLIFGMCDRINCVSRATMESTIPESMQKKCAVVYNGVDTKMFNPERGSGEVRKNLGIGDAPMILSNGRLVTQKGFTYLIDAFAKLKKEEKDAQLVIIGKGPLKDSIMSQASSLGVADSVKIITGIPENDLPFYYNAADMFVLPSLYEPSAVVLYEALGCGKPIVATNAGGNPEIVSEDCGFIVSVKSSEALYEKMKLVFDNGNLAKKLGDNSRMRALNNFDWDIIASKWDESYRALF